MTDPRLKLFDAGYTDLVSVAPPGAPISRNSGLKADDLGKRPAKKGQRGWYGYNWINSNPTRADVESWVRWGANVGLRGTHFPALDIDCTDKDLTVQIRRLAMDVFGPAPVRVGSPTKELLVYSTDTPFKRTAVKIGEHLVEWLGDQRQYLVYGTHPSGREYKWLGSPLWNLQTEEIRSVSLLDVADFNLTLAELFDGEIVGNGSNREVEVAQETLLAPSHEALVALMVTVPNEFDERDDYIKVGCAIKAAGQADEEGAFLLFSQWSDNWEGGNDPDTVRSDWRRMHPPYRVGWDYLVSLSGGGFNEMVHIFTADPDYEPPQLDRDPDETIPVDFTDDWCAEQIMPLLVDKLRYDWPNDRWHAWDGSRWAHATMGEQDRFVLDALRKLARSFRPKVQKIQNKQERAKANATLAKLGNASTLSNVTRMLSSHPSVVVGTDAFDTAEWEINTPSGTVDLLTGELQDHDPRAMHSKSTAVSPVPGAPRRWAQFIEEVTGGDEELARFMQKQAGYALTGVRREQTLSFVWGPGSNGKSVFVDALMAVLADYAATAPMDTFASSKGDKHPTDLAGLMGARLVTATETQSGRSWDEQRIKAITGGDRMRARFMRQDFVEFQPRFKLMLVGNHEPQIDNVDDAMRRRINIIPFTYKPPVPDLKLPEKLRDEYPQILNWMIEGCTMWQNEGLVPPECVMLRTQQYFMEEDQPRQWFESQCVVGEGTMTSSDAYRSWQLWTSQQGEYSGTQREFTKSLRPLEAEFDLVYGQVGPNNRRVRGWKGVHLIEDPHEIKGSLS